MQSTSELDEWRRQVKRESARLASRLWPTSELHRTLDELLHASGSPYAGVKVTLQTGGVSTETKVGVIDGVPLLQQGPVPFALDSPSNYRLEAFARSSAAAQATHAAQALIDLLRDFWKPNTREKFGLPSTDKPETIQLLEKSLFSLERSEGTCGFYVFGDLDHLKTLNDQVGHDAGDQALAAVSSIVAREFAHDAISLRRGGGADEFVVLFESSKVDVVLDCVRRTTLAIKALSFQGHSIDITWGVHTIVGTKQQNLQELEALAEAATKKEVEGRKEKRRGTIHFSTGPAGDRISPAPDEAKLFAAFTRTLAPTPRPFGNAWLNVLSALVNDSCIKSTKWNDTENALKQLLAWADLQMVGKVSREAVVGRPDTDFSTDLTAVEICLAVAHGILRFFWMTPEKPTVKLAKSALAASSRLALKMKSDDWSGASLFSGDQVLMSFGATSTEQLDLGTPVRNESPEVQCNSIAPVTLVRIGLDTKMETSRGIAIPNVMFTDVISVDDRPFQGGGLPDFWEAAIARLAIVWFSRPTARRIVVVGNPDHAAQTVGHLQAIETWDVARLAARLGLNHSYVEDLKERGIGATRVLQQDSSRLINTLYEESTQLTSHAANAPASDDGSRLLDRTLDIDEARLAGYEGIRCGTASEAYPIVLELLRKAGPEYAVYDDFGEELRELAGFELRLSTPILNAIPSFYRDSQDELKKYFDSVIWSQEGVLGSQLHDNGQFEWLLRHLESYLEKTPFRSSTRRAILVVKNQIDNARDYRPLGLVCIRVAPRLRNGKRMLDFFFVWRTVEAIVGFPYSLYGSIRFSEMLTRELETLLSKKGHDVGLEVGELTYVALSLHLSVGSYGLRIAKKIVDDASS